MPNELIRPIKRALAKEYGFKNVSVKNGSGTAWGWVDISIKINKPKDDATDSEIEKNVMNIAREALRMNGLKFYTYCADDGYGTEQEEVLLRLDY